MYNVLIKLCITVDPVYGYKASVGYQGSSTAYASPAYAPAAYSSPPAHTYFNPDPPATTPPYPERRYDAAPAYRPPYSDYSLGYAYGPAKAPPSPSPPAYSPSEYAYAAVAPPPSDYSYAYGPPQQRSYSPYQGYVPTSKPVLLASESPSTTVRPPPPPSAPSTPAPSISNQAFKLVTPSPAPETKTTAPIEEIIHKGGTN